MPDVLDAVPVPVRAVSELPVLLQLQTSERGSARALRVEEGRGDVESDAPEERRSRALSGFYCDVCGSPFDNWGHCDCQLDLI